MISSDIIRGYIDIIILFMLLEEPSYGYELSKQIKNRSEGKYNIKETTLYSAFTRLERNEFITSFNGVENYGNRRTYYRITPTGRDYYQQKCDEWRLTKEVIEKFIS